MSCLWWETCFSLLVLLQEHFGGIWQHIHSHSSESPENASAKILAQTLNLLQLYIWYDHLCIASSCLHTFFFQLLHNINLAQYRLLVCSSLKLVDTLNHFHHVAMALHWRWLATWLSSQWEDDPGKGHSGSEKIIGRCYYVLRPFRMWCWMWRHCFWGPSFEQAKSSWQKELHADLCPFLRKNLHGAEQWEGHKKLT